MIFNAYYPSEESALIMVDKVRKTLNNVHDFHRDYSDDYKIYYTQSMLEQIKKHNDEYTYVFDIIASIMKICELPERRVVLRVQGKNIHLELFNPYITRRLNIEINERTVWDIMFKKTILCPFCKKENSVNAYSDKYKVCTSCGKKFRVEGYKNFDIQQSLPL